MLQLGRGEQDEDVLADGEAGGAVAVPPRFPGELAPPLAQSVEQPEEAGQVLAGDQAVPAVEAVEEGAVAGLSRGVLMAVLCAACPAGVQFSRGLPGGPGFSQDHRDAPAARAARS